MGLTAIEFEFPNKPATIGFYSDLHLDSPNHDRKMLLADLEYGASLGARMWLGGDIFTVIMPLDRRSSGQHRRARMDALLDQILDEGVEVLGPYVDHIDLVCLGNHEVTALKYYYTDLVNKLRLQLQQKRSKSLPPIRHGGYTGFVILRFRDRNDHMETDTVYYHHGKGGSAPVTRGMIDVNRVIAGNRADVYWLQHKHVSTSDVPRVRAVDQKGNIEWRPLIAFHTAGYEGEGQVESWEKEGGYVHDWAEENFLIPQGQGCAFLQYTPKMVHNGYVRLVRVFSRRVM